MTTVNRLSRIGLEFADSISNVDFKMPITYYVPIIQADPTSGDCNDQRNGADWSSQVSFIQMKHRLGLFSRTSFALSDYDKQVDFF